jgi:hypothetical protein
MSKKILLSTVILILSIQLQAQLHFGARAGNNFARLSNNEPENIFGLSQFPNKTVHIGGIVQYEFSGLSDKFCLESGLILSWKGGNFEYRKSNVFSEIGLGSVSFNEKISLPYLEFPLNAILSFDMGTDKFQIITGPYMGILVGGKTKIHYLQSGLDGKKPKDYVDKSIPAKTMDLGINMGVGMEMDAIIVRIQYGYGLTNITKGGFNSDDIKNRVISFSIGYLFGDGY